MYSSLQTGQQVISHFSQQTYEVEYLLGEGSQGEVYQARLVLSPSPLLQEQSQNILQRVLEWLKDIWPLKKHLYNQPDTSLVALKWYHPYFATSAQQKILEHLIKHGVPNPESQRFLWPLDLVSTPELSGFGYIMPLREERFKDFKPLITKEIDPTFYMLSIAGFELVDAYSDLHHEGLCYGDISMGNAFLDPNTGDICICDNDNVVINKSISGIRGTTTFMAPEIMRNEALPSIQTDLYSLSVLLFHMFMLGHPLNGKREAAIRCLMPDDLIKLYGTDPLFIFDPDDASNYPVNGYQDNPLKRWPVYPQFFRDLFTQAFTEGIRDPDNGRIMENQWRHAMVKLRDSIFYCSSCQRENFYDIIALKATDRTMTCWACHRDLHTPLRIRITDKNNESSIVMLNHGSRLFPHHIQGKTYDFSHPVAEVIHYPQSENTLYLKNLSHEKWTVTWMDGTTYETRSGRVVPLLSGVKILFGSIQGEVRI